MSKIKTSELTEAQLDYAVANCKFVAGRIKIPAFAELEKVRILIYNQDNTPEAGGMWFSPSTDWAQGGPIIERENISLTAGYVGFVDSTDWFAQPNLDHPMWEVRVRGTTPLIAAMRCFVASKLGDEVEIPEELK